MKNKFSKGVLKWLLTLVVIGGYYWIVLPPINLQSRDFWSFVTFIVIVTVIINAFSQVVEFIKQNKSNTRVSGVPKLNLKALGKPLKVALIIVLGIVVLSAVASLIGAEIFNATGYKDLITIENGDFTTDVAEISQDQIPVVDRDTASRLGQRKLGEMADLVSQFEIEDIYTQINYKGKPVRVTPLMYGDIIKWLNNHSQGIPAYITVDMTTQETELVRLENGIKYSDSEYFMRDLNRALRFKYPTKIFDEISFEIDENGTPFWVASVVDFKVGIWSGSDIDGVVIMNASTGESKYYKLEQVPTWIDQVFDSYMIEQQLVYNGKYRSGFWNSIFGQRGVLQPTDGYNYLALKDDVYMYTGMTSVTSDESNVGFVLVNLRTKDTKFYTIPGAEEYSAMSSAEGQVQHLKYSATFPLLLNVSDRPTYFMSLKDGAGLVKMYAFVDVNQYQIVGTGNSVESAKADYISKLKTENVTEVPEAEVKETTAVIEKITSAVVDGNTVYYIKFQKDEAVYTALVTKSDLLPFAKSGDTVKYTVSGKVINTIEFE
ncbi:MAG: CvpA family protein [Ruminococcaceae bacterium]|nr:CvpA family protein [Oscillospiraceae bacterium]